ncbi:hypothetical protein D9615_009796 [Tricholomella constricta]|uniref:Uncharacterized protein n=1 Tax=Tricholomella constricta TaxID=117010 RepID=A0A8H5GTK2_9AGAR|nr:hypothetical protein D9615_009796 [Tricholomella constricta]
MSTAQNIPTSTPAGPPKHQSSMVRYVLLAMVVLSLLFSAVFSTIGILVLNKIGSQLTEIQQTAVWFHIFVYIIFAIFCILGVYACVVKRRGATSLFTSLVIGQILFSLGSGVLCLYLLFNNTPSQPWNANKCLAIASDSFTRELCQKSALLKGLAIAMFIVMWLVEIGKSIVRQFYILILTQDLSAVLIFLGNAFLSQLRDEALKFDVLDPKYDRDGDDC